MMTVVSFYLNMSCTLHSDLFHQLALKNPPYHLLQKYSAKIMSERQNMLNIFFTTVYQLYVNNSAKYEVVLPCILCTLFCDLGNFPVKWNCWIHNYTTILPINKSNLVSPPITVTCENRVWSTVGVLCSNRIFL